MTTREVRRWKREGLKRLTLAEISLAVVPLLCNGSTAPPGAVLLFARRNLVSYGSTAEVPLLPATVLPLELPLEVPSARFSPLDSQRYLAGTSHVLPPEPLIYFEVCQRYYRKESAVVPLPGSNGSATRYRRSWELVLPSTARRPAAVVPPVPGGCTAGHENCT